MSRFSGGGNPATPHRTGRSHSPRHVTTTSDAMHAKEVSRG